MDAFEQAPEIRLVETPEDIRASVAAFSGATRPVSFLRDLMRSTSYWVYDPASGGFGPGKFVGFRKMSVRRYLRVREYGSSGDAFDGNVTRTRIERVLGESFKESRSRRVVARRPS